MTWWRYARTKLYILQLCVPQVPETVCGVLYDEEKCKADADYLVLGDGDQGVLPVVI